MPENMTVRHFPPGFPSIFAAWEGQFVGAGEAEAASMAGCGADERTFRKPRRFSKRNPKAAGQAGKCLQKKSESRIERIIGLHGWCEAPVPACEPRPMTSKFADAGL
jgi:hypothetical protein